VNIAKRRFLLGALKLFNLGLLAMSFALATALLVSETGGGATLAAFLSIRVKLSNIVVCAAILLVWHAVFSFCGLYRSSRLSTELPLIVDSVKATTFATIFLMAVARSCKIAMITSRFIVLFWIFSSVLIVSGRVVIRYLLKRARLQGRNLRHMLILGTNQRAIAFARNIELRPEYGYRIVGFVDDEWPGLQDFPAMQYSLCCNFDGLSEYVRRNIIDEVAIYLPLRSFYEHTAQVAALCEQHGITMRFAADMFNLKIARSRADDLAGSAHITAYSGSLDGWPILVKRAVDVALSFTLLVVFAPMLGIVALLIRVTSGEPVLYRQDRVGLNKRRFAIYKFRTMVVNADKMLPQLEMLNEVAGPVFKIKNDPRMTPIGRFLRRASIDELPQLFNVLKGDMSLVGPRPLPVRDYEGFNEDWQRRRFSIRPGITCLWQVNGRSAISFEKWMQLDLQYVDEWSLWLDLKILARTVPAVLKGSGAA